MDRLLQDLRFAFRTLIRNPGFAVVAILTLGLGIGANTAVFSAINAVVLRPLPYGDPSRLVLIRQSAPAAGRPDTGVSIKEYFDYREQNREFEALVEYHQMSFDLLRRGEPDRVDTGVVSHNFFDVLGIRPILGRSFVADDDKVGAEPVLILSHRYWTSKFAGDPAVVGQRFEMNDRPHLVIGVLPNVPHYPQENDVYMPVLACPFRAAAERRIPENRRIFSILSVFGKLKPGVPAETAASGVGAICHNFTRDNPASYRATSGFQATTVDVQSALTEDARPMLLVLLGTTALVLLLACANVANLTLARLLRRDRELALRTALGLPRGRLLQQLLTESAVLALLGGIVGLGFAAATMNLLRMFLGRFTSRAEEIVLDPWVLAFTLIVATTTGLVFGTLPAVTSSRVQLTDPLKEGGRGSGTAPARRRLQEALVVAQVAVSVILLVAAVEDVVTLDELRTSSLGTPRTTAMLLSIFAGLAFIVTLTGIAGVLATSVAQRTREIGIRMALGESRGSVLRGVLQRGLILTGVGLMIGVIGALLTTRFLSAYLYATEPSDPLTLVAVVIAFVAAALVACAGPAWRATRVDPMIALRAD